MVQESSKDFSDRTKGKGDDQEPSAKEQGKSKEVDKAACLRGEDINPKDNA